MVTSVEDSSGTAREAPRVAAGGAPSTALSSEPERARGRIVLGEGGLWSFLGPLAWIVAGLLLGDLFPRGLSWGEGQDWLPLLRATFFLVGASTLLVEAAHFERWIFDLDARTLTWRHGLIDLRPRTVAFQSLDRVRIVLEERGPEDYLVAVHVRPEEESVAEALSCGRGLPEEARERAERMRRLLDEVRRRAASAAR
ncbi:MAG: hypothetical protein JNM84_22100 [Planctomycetes bacterium]|nr:hypothetical protein [Planctomycetota bacterium]